MQQVNQFLKGIIGDLDYGHVKPDSWVFPTHNIRIYNKRGQGFVVTGMDGNEEMFSVGNAYIIAAVEHRDIIYIVTAGKNIHNVWTTGIGCYPYPSKWDQGNSSTEPFVNKFGWLMNYEFVIPGVGIKRGPMVATDFGYSVESNVKLLIDDAFDESANLYLCDGVHTDKVVNSGFRIDGTINDFIYSRRDFKGKLNHVLYSLKPVVISAVSVPLGGSLYPGQYHLFFAYKTASFDKTEYGTESFPISVSDGDTITSVFGLPITDSENKKTRTGKKIVLHLDKVDTDYKYLSVGVMRFYGSGDGIVMHEEYEIAKDFVIPSSSFAIEITGMEDIKILTSGELYSIFLKERISTDHAFLDSRIWKVNLKSSEYDRSIYAGLSKKVTMRSFAGSSVDMPGYDLIANKNYFNLMNYQDSTRIYSELGYFDKEMYPFGLRFLLDSGIVTDVYPVTGRDELLGTPGHWHENAKGIFRSKKYDVATVIGLEFDLDSMMTEIRNDKKYSNIVGVYVVRGERIKNFLYEGVLEKTANGVTLMKDRKTDIEFSKWSQGDNMTYKIQKDLWFASDNYDNAYHIPVFRFKGNNRCPVDEQNYYSFPHAVYNDNGNDRTDKMDIGNLIVNKRDPKYEYSIAVPHPFEIKDGGSDEPLDSLSRMMSIDAIDTKLHISDDHYALFSPDFMTEVDHLTSMGGKYQMEIYRIYKEPTYSECTEEKDPEGKYKSISTPKRTRVFELGSNTGTGSPITFKSSLKEIIEVILLNGNSTIDLSLFKPNCKSYTPEKWNGKKFYFAVPDPNLLVHVQPFHNAAAIPLVIHSSKTWICISDTLNAPAGDDVTPGANNPSGNIYWKEVKSVVVWSQEYASYSFVNGGVNALEISPGYWALPGCVAGTVYHTVVNPALPPTEVSLFHEVTVYNIEKGTHKGRGKFSAYAEDGMEYKVSGKKGLYSVTGYYTSCQKTAFAGAYYCVAPDLIHYNRSYQTPAYMGIIANNKFHYKNGETLMVRLYKKLPDDPTFFNDTVTRFNPEYTQYWNISDLIDTSVLKKNIFKGDNFKSMSWFRMAHHVDFDNNPKPGHPSNGFRSWYRKDIEKVTEQDYLKPSYFLDNSYKHGILYGMFTSNRHNVSLRSELNVVDKNNVGLTYTFFPHVADTGDPLGWIYSSGSDSDLVESLNINDGYNDSSGYVKVTAVPVDVPVDSVHRSTRMAFSQERIVESYRDGYRSMLIQNQRDFETNFGEILRVDELFGSLITFRRDAVVKHFVGQKKLTEDLGYGESAIYLAKETKPVLYYGLQDWHAFVKTKNGIYAIDVKSEMIYYITMGYGKNSTTMRDKPALLSQQYMIEKDTKDLIAILNKNRTTPMDMNGIVLGYNPDYGEVYFTFLNKDKFKTLVFNENLQFFTGTNGLDASLYATLNKGYMMAYGGGKGKVGSIYQGDVESGSTVICGLPEDNILSFIVNGQSEKESSVILTKIFESLHISSPHRLLKEIKYATETQRGSYTFTENSNDFWKDSKWIEGLWNIPIIRESDPDKDKYYDTESVFRGKWLKITLIFQADPEFSISEITSMFNISYS